MKIVFVKKFVSILLLMTILFSMVSVYAQQESAVNVDIKDISATTEALPILSGEVKIKISLSGLKSDANILQIALDFSGNMDYKAVQWLIEKDSDVISSLQVVPDGDVLYLSAVFNERVIKGNGDKPTDICILTFRGETGDSVFLSLIEDADESYIGEYLSSEKENLNTMVSDDEIAATAIENGAKALNAKVSLVMDKVTDFNLKSTKRNIVMSIIGEDDKFPVMFSTPIDENTNAIVPTLVVDTILAANQTYTVRIEGPGYISFEKTGVSFENVLKVENDEFIPGELVEDGVIDIEDKKKFDEILAGGIYDELTERADFNRDGRIDSKDAKVYDDIDAEKEFTVPAKLKKPSVTGGAEKITVKWSTPDNGGTAITGYIIKYGTSKTKLDKTKEIKKANIASETVTGLLPGTTYYVQIAAVNNIGVGEFSDIVSAKTDPAVSGGGNGGGNGGGGSGFGGGGNSGALKENVGSENYPKPEDEFNDLQNYSWATDSIYTLKDKGIINGTSATTFAPGANIRRGDFILILARMVNLDGVKEKSFIDVPADSYYADAIAAAKFAGIATGDGANFYPDNSITRQDLITLAYRAFMKFGYIERTTDDSVLDVFNDRSLISDYAVEAMSSMVNVGIIKGSSGNVNPLGYATRAEVAVMCARLHELIK